MNIEKRYPKKREKCCIGCKQNMDSSNFRFSPAMKRFRKKDNTMVTYYAYRSYCRPCQNRKNHDYTDKSKINKSIRARRIKSYTNDPRNKQKVESRKIFTAAVSKGILKRPTICEHLDEICKGRIEGHHSDYSKPLSVIWVCQKHHNLIHHHAKRNYMEGFI